MNNEHTSQSNVVDDDMLPEYDFTNGVRGKHYRAYRSGYTVTVRHADGTTTVQHYQPESGTVVLAPDVQAYFPDAEAVNTALRALINLIPHKPLSTVPEEIDKV